MGEMTKDASQEVIITQGTYLASAVCKEQYPEVPRKEIVFIGRSNVGKSSLINSLTRVKNLARVSSQPGKTQTINFYEIGAKLPQVEERQDFYLVDLPGYGFAKVDKAEKMRWGQMMDDYFQQSTQLTHVLHLVDIRHEPTQDDMAMNRYFHQMDIPFTVVATKADKISRGARMKHLAPICRALSVQPWEIIPFSSEDMTGRDKLLELVETVMAEEAEAGEE